MSLPILRNLSPRRLISRLSVRARIIAITLIPVLGFLANGAAYVAGERDVDRAVDSVDARNVARRRQPRIQERGRRHPGGGAQLRGAAAIGLSASLSVTPKPRPRPSSSPFCS